MTLHIVSMPYSIEYLMHAYTDSGILGSNDGNDQNSSPNPELSDGDDIIMSEDTLDDDSVHAGIKYTITLLNIQIEMYRSYLHAMSG